MTNSFENKTILITGACGTVGSALAEALLSGSYGRGVSVVGIDNNESEVFYISEKYKTNPHARFLLADIRDIGSTMRAMRNVHYVIHCAALKHVVICEDSPDAMVNTNITGLQNIIEAANANGVEKVVFTSSDKAVNPSSNMGASKLLGEGLIRSAAKNNAHGGTIFASTRFGNVLGSRGSVIPIFERQIKSGFEVTLTHKDMTRFIMGIHEAVRLVLDSVALARGGEIFVTKMPIIKIHDLAEVMIAHYAKTRPADHPTSPIKEIGIKQGEKLYEELMTIPESGKALELNRYFVLLQNEAAKLKATDADYGEIMSRDVTDSYSSEAGPCLSHAALLTFLTVNQLLSY
jgi:FlaA1/EpsC-like NDP-sugar epimerase